MPELSVDLPHLAAHAATVRRAAAALEPLGPAVGAALRGVAAAGLPGTADASAAAAARWSTALSGLAEQVRQYSSALSASVEAYAGTDLALARRAVTTGSGELP